MNHKCAHILLVEGDRTYNDLIRESFASYGDLFRLEAATTLGKARTLLKHSRIDLIIAGASLPDGKGIDLLNHGRTGPNLPVLLLTNPEEQHEVEEDTDIRSVDILLRTESSVRVIPRVANRILCRWNYMEEIRKREAAIRETEVKHRAILKAIPDFMFLLDRDGTLLDFEGTGEGLFALPSDLLGKRIQDVMPLEIANQSLRHLDRALSTGEVQVFEVETQIKGEPRYYETRMAASGEDAVVAIIRDTTHRRRTEEKVRQKRSMEAMKSLIRGITHEFNNILTTVIVQSDLMLMKLRRSDPCYDSADEIKRIGERAARIIEHLRAFGGTFGSSPENLDLNVVVTEMKRTLRLFMEEDTDLVDNLDDGLGLALADKRHIQQILLTLAVHSRNTERRSRRFAVRTQNADVTAYDSAWDGEIKPGPYIILSVSNCGFDSEENMLTQGLDAFSKTQGRLDGMGSGLPLVINLVKSNQGHVRVYAAAGGGVIVRIYLPRLEEPRQDRGPVLSARSVAAGQETILLVEDDARVLKSLSSLLARNGYNVVEARSGGEALRRFARYEGAIHLTVTDVKMPSMTGPELAERLRTFDPDMRVLFISGLPRDFLFPGGVTDYGTSVLEKPLTRESLLNKVRNLLELPPMPRS